MATTDGAGSQSGGDPVLEGALSEMVTEGSVDLASNFDPGPESTSQSTGGSSAAPAAAPPAKTGDDGSVQAARATVPPTDAGSAAPAAADPLAGTEPVGYTVNGETRTLPWGRLVPGEGVLLTEAEVPQLQSLAERAEVLDRVHRDITEQHSALERQTAWPTTDSDGKEITLTGIPALEASSVAHARKDALIGVMDAILTDPAKLLSLLAKDGQGNIVVDPSAVETLTMRAQLAADGAEKQARSQFTKMGTPATPAAPSGSVNYQEKAPAVIKQAAGANFAALLPEDHTHLAGQIGRYVRTVTAEDRLWNPSLKVGGPIVDAAYTTVVQHLANSRAAAKTQAAAAETAGKHNAGMDRGRQPAKQPVKPTPPTPAKRDEDRKSKADWEGPLAGALSEMGIAR